MFGFCCLADTAPFGISPVDADGSGCFVTDVVGGRVWFVHTLPMGAEGLTGSAVVVFAGDESWRLPCCGVLMFEVPAEVLPFVAERF